MLITPSGFDKPYKKGGGARGREGETPEFLHSLRTIPSNFFGGWFKNPFRQVAT